MPDHRVWAPPSVTRHGGRYDYANWPERGYMERAHRPHSERANGPYWCESLPVTVTPAKTEYREEVVSRVRVLVLSVSLAGFGLIGAACVPVKSPPPGGGGCDPNYSPCVPIAPDVDCAGGSGDGPAYVGGGPVFVTGVDVYNLDANGDGVGCE